MFQEESDTEIKETSPSDTDINDEPEQISDDMVIHSKAERRALTLSDHSESGDEWNASRLGDPATRAKQLMRGPDGLSARPSGKSKRCGPGRLFNRRRESLALRSQSVPKSVFRGPARPPARGPGEPVPGKGYPRLARSWSPSPSSSHTSDGPLSPHREEARESEIVKEGALPNIEMSAASSVEPPIQLSTLGRGATDEHQQRHDSKRAQDRSIASSARVTIQYLPPTKIRLLIAIGHNRKDIERVMASPSAWGCKSSDDIRNVLIQPLEFGGWLLTATLW